MLSMQLMHMINGCSMHNIGGSDQAFILALAAAWKVMFNLYESILISATSNLHVALPAGLATLSNAEYRCSTECLLIVADEMKDYEYYSLSQDVGHRAGSEHLIKMISYPLIDNNGHFRVRNFCLNIDSCGRTTE